MQFLKDYDRTINYHPGKVNIVADALSRKSEGVLVRHRMVVIDLIDNFQN